MTKVVNRKSAVDSLFAYLISAVSQDSHLNVLHTTGIWTTRRSEITVLTDPTIVYIVQCFLATPVMHLAIDKNKSSDSEYVTLFAVPAENQHKLTTQYLQF